MTALDKRNRQAIQSNFSQVIDFLDTKLRKTSVHLSEAPCYFYTGKELKLEVTVFSNPTIATIKVRILNLRNYDREPSFECSYDLDGLSIAMFQERINDLIAEIDQTKIDS